jgi:hypothetical protein
MATFEKREKEKKKKQKQRKSCGAKKNAAPMHLPAAWDAMMAYVDENGRLTNTPPDPSKRVEIDASEIVLGVPRREETEEDPVHQGKVDFFDPQKGFGFINADSGRDRYFFSHQRHLGRCVRW